MDAGFWVGLAGFVAAVGAVLNSWWQNRQKAETTTIDQWREIATRQSAEIDLLKKHDAEQMRIIVLIYEAHGECESNVAELYGWVVRYHDIARDQTPGRAVPEPPPRPARKDLHRQIEFLLRTSQQNAALAGAVPAAQPTP